MKAPVATKIIFIALCSNMAINCGAGNTADIGNNPEYVWGGLDIEYEAKEFKKREAEKEEYFQRKFFRIVAITLLMCGAVYATSRAIDAIKLYYFPQSCNCAFHNFFRRLDNASADERVALLTQNWAHLTTGG